MKLTMLGAPSAPVVAVLSTWDPFHQEHAALLSALTRYARRRGLSPMAVMLDPAPPLLLQGAARWAVYHDPDSRLRYLDAAGLDGVAHVLFEPADLERGAPDFFKVLVGGCPLSEFWLRHGQSIGSRGDGNDYAVWTQSMARRFHLRMLPREDGGRNRAAYARDALKAGKVRAAAALVGSPPAITRPDRGGTRSAWRAGEYIALPFLADGSRGDRLVIEFRSQADGTTTFQWPNPQVRTLSFVAGPADDPERPAFAITSPVAGSAGTLADTLREPLPCPS